LQTAWNMKPRATESISLRHDVCPPSKSRVGLRELADGASDGLDGDAFALPASSDSVRHARIAVDGSWFEVDGVRGDISRRPVLRRVLAAFVAHHASGTRRPLTMHEVLAAGWPNERCVRDSGAARVYQTVKRLRQIGLGSLLEHDGRGYWLTGSPLIEGLAATAA